jgi:hypothetical protein
MATTTKKTTTNKNTSSVKNTENKKSYEELENELNELKEMIKSLSIQKEEQINKATKIETISPDYIEINPNKRIAVVSLIDGILILTAGTYDKGKFYRFTHWGQVIFINYHDLVEILHYNYSFASKGLFFICDPQVILNHGLQDIYQKILSKEQIENLLTMPDKEAKLLFQNTTDEQRENIVSIIINKINNGENVDYNKVKMFSEIYGQNIEDLAELSIFKPVDDSKK